MNILSKLNLLLFPGSKEYPKNGALKTFTLGLQHAFAMSCATILVPLLTGLDVGVALFAAGVGTLIFHLCTGGKMPTFLGSSFAFITALQAVIGTETSFDPDFGATQTERIASAMGGIVVAGAFYLVLALLIKFFGSKFIDKLFPPVVRGVGIAIIGLNLASAAIDNIQSNNGFEMFSAGYYWSWILALITCVLAIVLSSYGKGMVKQSSIVIALFAGYVLTLIVSLTGLAPEGLMNLGAISSHSWFEVPAFVLPRFNLKAVGMIAPIAIVTCVEHVGDVYANGAVVGRNFTQDPGLHRTMLGDGLATLVAGLFGGPANTTYSENTAVLAATGNYNPVTLRVAAVIAIVISFFGKAIGVVETVPNCVLGGACIVLYGMISSVGLRTLVENHVDFTKNRNLSIAAVMLVLAMGGAVIGGASFSFSGIGLGIIAGILLNLLLPESAEKGLAHSVPEDEIVSEKK
ncbi:MAG: uracil-xanthine permease [Clostridia bacterium]|nr:uracil-xanthine permease [Clostridia bacterium]